MTLPKGLDGSPLEIPVDYRRADVRRAERELDPVARHGHVTLLQRSDAVALAIPVVARPEPGEVDQPQRDGARPAAGERLGVEVVAHLLADRRQRLAEADQLVELRE